jgi:Cu-Zn family superoxide dismutase
MKVQTLALLAGCAFFAVSCGTTKRISKPKSNTKTGGTAKFTQKGNEVVMKLDVTNLTPGIHAVHIHEKGDCSAADGTSTGGHWNPSKTITENGELNISIWEISEILRPIRMVWQR